MIYRAVSLFVSLLLILLPVSYAQQLAPESELEAQQVVLPVSQVEKAFIEKALENQVSAAGAVSQGGKAQKNTVPWADIPFRVKIIAKPESVSVNEGEYKLLKASVDGEDGAMLSYTWLRNGEIVSQGSYYYFAPEVKEGDADNLYELTVIVSNGNSSIAATEYIVVTDALDCRKGETQSEKCGTDVGMCVAGTRTRACQEDYLWSEWSECIGEVKPVQEDCGTLEDNGCDGIANDQCSYDEADLAAAWLAINAYDSAGGVRFWA